MSADTEEDCDDDSPCLKANFLANQQLSRAKRWDPYGRTKFA